MTGYPAYNFPTFMRSTLKIRGKGHTVISPVELDVAEKRVTITGPDGFRVTSVDNLYSYPGNWSDLSVVCHAEHQELIKRDLREIVLKTPEGITFLPGWQHSPGAVSERTTGKMVGCKMFRYYPDTNDLIEEKPPLIIGLAGYGRVGKDTAGKFLMEDFGFERLAFADAIRDFLEAVNPIVYYDGTRLNTFVREVGWDETKHDTEVRELLQRTGTEAARKVLGQNIWIDTLHEKMRPGHKYVITDVRLPGEMAYIRREGGVNWHITREGFGPLNAHETETEVHNGICDRTIANDDKLDIFRDLIYEEARKFLTTQGALDVVT